MATSDAVDEYMLEPLLDEKHHSFGVEKDGDMINTTDLPSAKKRVCIFWPRSIFWCLSFLLMDLSIPCMTLLINSPRLQEFKFCGLAHDPSGEDSFEYALINGICFSSKIFLVYSVLTVPLVAALAWLHTRDLMLILVTGEIISKHRLVALEQERDLCSKRAVLFIRYAALIKVIESSTFKAPEDPEEGLHTIDYEDHYKLLWPCSYSRKFWVFLFVDVLLSYGLFFLLASIFAFGDIDVPNDFSALFVTGCMIFSFVFGLEWRLRKNMIPGLMGGCKGYAHQYLFHYDWGPINLDNLILFCEYHLSPCNAEYYHPFEVGDLLDVLYDVSPVSYRRIQALRRHDLAFKKLVESDRALERAQAEFQKNQTTFLRTSTSVYK